MHNILDDTLTRQLKTHLQNLQRPVQLVLQLDVSGSDKDKHRQKKAAELNQLAEEIATLNPLIELSRSSDTAERSERAPSLLIRSQDGNEIRFAGVPLGHEFSSLVLALLQAGGHPVKLDSALIERIRNLQGEFHFETFVSLGCQTCPTVVQTLNMMAALNPAIKHTMIDGAVFSEEASTRNIMSVPCTLLNGETFSQGRIDVEDILDKIDMEGSLRQTEELNAREAYDMLIIGGGPAGASAAIYAARKGIRTAIVAERFGGQMLDTLGIENFISVQRTEGASLVRSLEEHVKSYPVDIITHQQVSTVERSDPASPLITVTLASGACLQSRSVVVATGARWREMQVPGEQEYRGRGVAYCPHCDGPLFENKRVAVIGGGNSGIEAAIDLSGIAAHVTVLEFAEQLRADELLQARASQAANIDIIVNAQTLNVSGNGEKVTALEYRNRETGASDNIELDGVFVQIGLSPNSDFLSDTVALNERGEIITDARGASSMPGVFAAGDVTDSAYKQIIIAMGDGAKAALGAYDYLIRQSVADGNELAA